MRCKEGKIKIKTVSKNRRRKGWRPYLRFTILRSVQIKKGSIAINANLIEMFQYERRRKRGERMKQSEANQRLWKLFENSPDNMKKPNVPTKEKIKVCSN
tara:strand:+ start:223 stop:522 length:300 start_codon:yes stop_codon:yes gene_type:complete